MQWKSEPDCPGHYLSNSGHNSTFAGDACPYASTLFQVPTPGYSYVSLLMNDILGTDGLVTTETVCILGDNQQDDSAHHQQALHEVLLETLSASLQSVQRRHLQWSPIKHAHHANVEA